MKTGSYNVKMILLCFLTLWSLSAQAVQKQPEGYLKVENRVELVALLNEKAAEISSISSHFIQKKQLEFLDETIISKGEFLFKKENNLRWAYLEPFEYVIVIHEGKFHIRDGEKHSAYDIDSNPVFAQINRLIVDMVRGNITDERFDIEAFENNNFYLVNLMPKDASIREVISNMEIYFSKSDLTVSEVLMKENENDYTVITFIDKKINVPIEDQVFSVKH